jgi:hypothetical protein
MGFLRFFRVLVFVLICFVVPGVLFYGGVEYEGLGNNYSLSQRVESSGSLLFNGNNGVLKDGDGDVSVEAQLFF